MSFDLTTIGGRKDLIQEINSQENLDRKDLSLKQFEVYKGRIKQHVKEYLLEHNDPTTVKEMPLVSCANLAKRVGDQEASIYKSAPFRTFNELDESQTEAIQNLYVDAKADRMSLKSNKVYAQQRQGLIQIVPKGGRLIERVLWGHHYDVITDPNDPEKAIGYAISGVDKSRTLTGGDASNQRIADKEDYKAKLKRYVVWTDELNFIMDGRGEVIKNGDNDDGTNKLGFLPFIDVSYDKDFEYFVRSPEDLLDFTIQFNAGLSELFHIMRMQGFAQAVMTGPKELAASQLTVGLNKVLKMVVEDGDTVTPTFEFVSPNPDLAGSISVLETIIASFLTSRGIDPKAISLRQDSSAKYTSGLERLLAMIERFEASKEEVDLFKGVEQQRFKIYRGWHNAAVNTDLLDDKYVSREIKEDASVTTEFAKPEIVLTESDQVDLFIKKKAAGVYSRVDYIMETENIETRELAIERLKEIDADNAAFSVVNPEEETENDGPEDSEQPA